MWLDHALAPAIHAWLWCVCLQRSVLYTIWDKPGNAGLRNISYSFLTGLLSSQVTHRWASLSWSFNTSQACCLSHSQASASTSWSVRKLNHSCWVSDSLLPGPHFLHIAQAQLGCTIERNCYNYGSPNTSLGVSRASKDEGTTFIEGV